MELIKPGTNIDFVRIRYSAMMISGVMILAGLISLLVHGGPNYGIDFTGGTVAQVRFHSNPNIDEIRGALGSLGLESGSIQDFSDTFNSSGESAGKTEYLIRLPLAESEDVDVAGKIKDALTAKFGADSFDVMRIETVGPRVGSALRQQAVMAVLAAMVMMGFYVWFRFEFRFGVGAAVALLHDVLITIGFLSIFNYEIDLTIVAALLTIVGFSVNDTVIISDRIRENMRKSRRESLAMIINGSINETLSRTVITTGTAVLVVIALFVLGGNVIRGFAFSLLVGFLVGTYSSIFISSPIVLAFEGTRFGSTARSTSPARARS